MQFEFATHIYWRKADREVEDVFNFISLALANDDEGFTIISLGLLGVTVQMAVGFGDHLA